MSGAHSADQGGPWTRHGHPVGGITVYPQDPRDRPPIARCGGEGLCSKCAADAARIRDEHREGGSDD